MSRPATALPFRRLKWGGRWDLNPRPLEPQSSALPLSYAHHCKTSLVKPIQAIHPRPDIYPAVAATGKSGGAPGRTRTCNPRLRRPMLYPVELQAQIHSAAGPPIERRRSKTFRPAARPFLAGVDQQPGRCDGARRSWSGWQDSNLRPTAPKAVALPGCATPRLAD